MKHLFTQGLLYLAPITNLLGGALLVISALLPVHHPPEIAQEKLVLGKKKSSGVDGDLDTELKNELPVIPTEAEVKYANKVLENIKHTLKDLDYRVFSEENKSFLKDAGWDLTSAGILMSCVNRLAAGYVSKQPGMVVSSIGQMLTVPVLLIHPSVSAQAAMAFFLGPWLASAANKVRNKFDLEPGEKPREFDMAPLLQPKALETLMQEQNPSGTDKFKAWCRHAFKMLKFVGTDQALLVKDTSKSLAHWWAHRKDIKSHAGENIQEAYNYLIGKQEKTPELFEPSDTQNRVAAMLMYAGTVPILFLGGAPEGVMALCNGLRAAGNFTASIPLFATGIHNKELDMIIGIPLMAAGTAASHTDAGMGVSRIGMAGFMNHLRKEVKKHQEAEKHPEIPHPPKKEADADSTTEIPGS